jgi:hypothetical protein
MITTVGAPCASDWSARPAVRSRARKRRREMEVMAEGENDDGVWKADGREG